MWRLVIAAVVIVSVLWLVGCRGAMDEYAEAVRQIKDGQIVVPPEGRVHLPSRYRHLSAEGIALAETDESGKLMVFFKKWRGKGRNVEGFLFSAKPLAKAKEPFRHGPDIYMAGQPLIVEEKIEHDFYRVAFRWD